MALNLVLLQYKCWLIAIDGTLCMGGLRLYVGDEVFHCDLNTTNITVQSYSRT